MVPLLPSRRRAEQLARALEGEHTGDARLQDLLDAAARLAAVPLVEPRPEFRDSLRGRLLEAAAVELPAQAAAATTATGIGAAPGPMVLADDVRAARRRRRLVAAATGLVLAGGGTGVGAASEQALPGDMLYPVKRTIEAAEVTLAHGAGEEGRALLARAVTRLDEAEALKVLGSTSTLDLEGVENALVDFSGDAAAGGERLLAAFADRGDPSDVRVLRHFTVRSHETLTDLARVLPPALRPALVEADRTVVALDDRAVALCPHCAGVLPLLDAIGVPVPSPDLADPSADPRDDIPVRTEPSADHRGRRTDDRPHPGAWTRQGDPRDDAVRLLPGARLEGRHDARTYRDTAPRTGGRSRDGLGLDGVLRPDAPSRRAVRPQPTGGAEARDVESVVEPVTEPLRTLGRPGTVRQNDGSMGAGVGSVRDGVAGLGQDAVDTGQDAVDPGQNAVDTGRNAVDTGRNAVDTGQGAVDTGRNAVDTGQDADSAGQSQDTGESVLHGTARKGVDRVGDGLRRATDGPGTAAGDLGDTVDGSG